MTSNSTQNGLVGDRVVYLVEEQDNPSTDCFVLPAVSARGHRVVRCRFADLPAADDLTGAMVVFVRYVPPAWARLVAAIRPRLRGLVFFMDDDVLDVRASAGMPWHYRWKLARLAAVRLWWLRRHGAELWVSTSYLQNKYATWQPRLVLPSPSSNATGPRRVFYHGTASHEAEKRWLRPVAEEALRRDERLVFEIVGGPALDSLYRGLPRVNVMHQMKWPAYQAFLSMPGRLVGLAPLMNGPFNRARSYTKFFDITRCGAVGVYSPNSACADVVSHGVEGLVVALDQEAWVEAILNLVRDEPIRQNLLRNAEARLGELAGKAQGSYLELMEPSRASRKNRSSDLSSR
ncbi:MAG: hypothetical protein ACRET6_03690 [Burkholderiales bacterium]